MLNQMETSESQGSSAQGRDTSHFGVHMPYIDDEILNLGNIPPPPYADRQSETNTREQDRLEGWEEWAHLKDKTMVTLVGRISLLEEALNQGIKRQSVNEAK